MSKFFNSAVLREIRRLYDNQESGTLALRRQNERIEVLIREGMIEAASSNISGRRLGDYLVKEEFATAKDLDALESVARRQKILFGEAVVRKGLVPQADLTIAVRRQAVDLIDFAFKHGFLIDPFKTSLRSYFAPAHITFHHLLLDICRSNAEPIESVDEVKLTLKDADLSVYHWYPQELYVLSELQYPNTFERLLKTTGLQEGSLRRILGVLKELDTLDYRSLSESDEAIEESTALVRNSEFPFEHFIPVVSHAALNEKLEVAKNETSFTSEQFKNLKVHISEASSSGPMKVLTVSSPDAKDGKSLISSNLAFSFALDPGRRVIVVDCDLRSPSLGNYLGVSSEPGLLQYLANGHLSPYCYVRKYRNLYFLTTGGVASNPVEILSMQKMKQLIEHLKKDFDTIILDAPPYGPIADARIVTGLSDGLIMVVRRGKTSYNSTDRAFKAIDRNKFLGVVFNDVQPMLFHTYYNFGYYQDGGNKNVYPNNAPKIRNTPKNYLES